MSTIKDQLQGCFPSIYYLDGSTSSSRNYNYSLSSPSDITLCSSNHNKLNLIVDINKDALELPCAFVDLAYYYLRYNSEIKYGSKVDRILIPLFINKPDRWRRASYRNAKTAAPAFKLFFEETTTFDFLTAIKINDELFYGNKGLILDKDFIPLMMLSLLVKKEEYKYTPVKALLRINPIVFSREDSVSKAIKGTVLKGCFEGSFTDVIAIYRNNKLSGVLHNDFKVIIDDFSKMFDKPKVPNITDNSETINEFLNSNVDTIFK